MITKENLQELAIFLGFTKDKKCEYYVSENGLAIDFENEKLIYPKELKKSDETTSNFSHNENFVVFECVNALLDLGYKPENLEIEPRWKLGRSTKSGKADILVCDHSKNAYLIIECKTYGDEFEKEWNNMCSNGGQLFSYAWQEQKTKFICLYASDFDKKLTHQSKIINIQNIFKAFSPQNNDELVASWINNGSIFNESGIFENSEPYFIGEARKTTQNLQDIGEQIDEKYNKFATILRKHNISSKENAFDKLVNLFLCKIVDEIKNKDNLKFTYKGDLADSFFDMQDRLEELYQIGMKEFLNEDVTYINDDAIDRSFLEFKDNALKQTIKKYFLELKFFSSNNFAFLEVYNKELFNKNAIVLKEIIQEFENLRLKSNKPNQFLGNLFEMFLDGGFQQSEGQFFTPFPIVKFIIRSLPLNELIENDKNLSIIDYACGAGHFLIEYANELKHYIAPSELSAFYSQIYGIEKEYRLSKVSKVSAFMYGQEDINIVYADGLKSHKNIKDGTFSLLVANPPYSVKGFLQTLDDEDRQKFSLNEFANDESNNIECFFIERAYQLLKPHGIAAIILPSSFLNKSTPKIYEKAREIVLKNFKIIAICELSNKTFGKTGTNTITLFLKKRFEPPRYADILSDRAINNFINDDGYKDENLLADYAKFQDFDENELGEFLNKNIKNTIFESEIFKDYEREFEKSNAYKELIGNFDKPKFKRIEFEKTPEFKDINNDKKALNEALKNFKIPQWRKDELKNEAFVKFAKEIELEKIYYFILAKSQQNVLIIKSPTENKEQKEFLGYEWSESKGKEGIKLLNNVSIKNDELDEAQKQIISSIKGMDIINTPLYNPKDKDDNLKLSFLIRQNFNADLKQIPGNLTKFASVSKLVDMMDFKKPKFDKAINLSVKSSVEIVSKFPLVRLGECGDFFMGGTPSRNISQYWNGDIKWLTIGDYANFDLILDTKEKITDLGIQNSSAKVVKSGCIVVSIYATIGRVGILGSDMATNQAIVALKVNQNFINKYVMYSIDYFKFQMFDKTITTSQKNINLEILKSIKIPNPPREIQEKIVAECEKVYDEFKTIRMEISELKAKMSEIFSKFDIKFSQNSGGGGGA
uniref:N-6 DNA methylase n=1 Tax=Campylobacter curvus TaxID=200 RepID=UPI00147002FB